MLPKTLKYGSKVESAGAKSVRTNIQPQTGSVFNLGDTITFNIPTRQNLVLVPSESYLRFDLSQLLVGTASVALRLDSCGAHGLIQRIRIWHGSNLLQDIDNYGMLAKMFYDLQVSSDQCYGKSNVMMGTRSDLVCNLADCTALTTIAIDSAANCGAAIDAYFQLQQIPVKQINSGDSLRDSTSATTNIIVSGNKTAATTYTINLLSLIGSLCSQNYIPLFAMTSAPLRVEITLVDQLYKALAIASATGTVAANVAANYIANVEYVAQFIELGDQAMSMVQESLQGQPIQFVVPDYRNFQNSFTVATGSQINLPIPAKFSSLKSLLVAQRDQGTGALTYFPYSSVKNGLASYYFRVGASVVPTKAPATTPEMFCEVMKAIGSLSDLNLQPSIEKTSYELVASVADTLALEACNASSINSGSFYIGLDLENYCSAPKDQIFAGWNSNTDDIYLVLTYGTVTGTSMRYDAFAMFDCVFVAENGTAYVRF